jgi:hypothetical protein
VREHPAVARRVREIPERSSEDSLHILHDDPPDSTEVPDA